MNTLIIDDSRAMRRILTNIMNRLGFEVTEAENGREGLEKLLAGESGVSGFLPADGRAAEFRATSGVEVETQNGKLQTAEFTLRGESISALAQPYRFYLLQRVQDAYAALPNDEQAGVDALLSRCDMKPILTTTLNRRIVRADNLEVWQ